MRVFANAYELISEIYREVWEMGHIVHPQSMQNKVVGDNPEFATKEITNYSYCLTNLYKQEYLFLSDHRSKDWADAEFEERISLEYSNPGEAWKIRKDIWEQFLNVNGVFEYSYNERIMAALPTVIKELKIHPDSRQAIITIWDPTDVDYLGGNARVPCSIYYQLMIRNNRLNIIYNQRSADVVTHFGNDVYLAWKLMAHIAKEVGVKPGYLFHNIGSLHSYKKDWPILKTCIQDVRESKLG